MKKFKHVDLIVKESEKVVLHIPDAGNFRGKAKQHPIENTLSPKDDMLFTFGDIDFTRGVNQ